jgi:predicted DNA-binding protein (MmcQ/YjbR family)
MTQQQNTLSRNVSIDSVPAPGADVRVEVIEGELLLYHPEQTKAIYLNPSAAVIWSLCDGRRRAQEIIDLIAESYPDSKPNLTEEVLATLEELYESRVLMVKRDSTEHRAAD